MQLKVDVMQVWDSWHVYNQRLHQEASTPIPDAVTDINITQSISNLNGVIYFQNLSTVQKKSLCRMSSER